MATGQEELEAHNAGEQDRANAPSPGIADLFAGVMSIGFLGSDWGYHPPSDPVLKEAYDKGWENNH